MPQILQYEDLPGRIREAVASGDFEKARLLWIEYGERFRENAARGPISLKCMAEARDLAEWTRVTTMCARSFARDRLARISVSRRYSSAARQPAHTLALCG